MQQIPGGHRIGGSDRPMHAAPVPRNLLAAGLAGKILHTVGQHLPLIQKLPDRRLIPILADLEKVLEQVLSKGEPE